MKASTKKAGSKMPVKKKKEKKEKY